MRDATPASLWLSALGQGARTAMTETTVEGFRALAAVVTQDLREGGESWRADDVLIEGMEARLVLFFTPPDFLVQPQRVMCRTWVYADGEPVHDTGEVDCHDARISGFSGDLFPTRFMMGFDLGPDEVGTVTCFEMSVTDPDRGIKVPLEVSFKTRAKVLQ